MKKKLLSLVLLISYTSIVSSDNIPTKLQFMSDILKQINEKKHEIGADAISANKQFFIHHDNDNNNNHINNISNVTKDLFEQLSISEDKNDKKDKYIKNIHNNTLSGGSTKIPYQISLVKKLKDLFSQENSE